jgi:hypothetical protein
MASLRSDMASPGAAMPSACDRLRACHLLLRRRFAHHCRLIWSCSSRKKARTHGAYGVPTFLPTGRAYQSVSQSVTYTTQSSPVGHLLLKPTHPHAMKLFCMPDASIREASSPQGGGGLQVHLCDSPVVGRRQKLNSIVFSRSRGTVEAQTFVRTSLSLTLQYYRWYRRLKVIYRAQNMAAEPAGIIHRRGRPRPTGACQIGDSRSPEVTSWHVGASDRA